MTLNHDLIIMNKKVLADKIRQLRISADFSQQEIANFLKINRASYSLIESANRNVKVHELKLLSEKFDIPLSILLSDSLIPKPQIALSPKNKKKFKKLVLYILHKCGMKPNIGKTVLYKLLYFSDFNYYEKYNKKLSGIPYIKLPMWPAPYNFDFIIQEMKDDNELIEIRTKFMWYSQHRYIPNISLDVDFSTQEKEIVDDVVTSFSDNLASEISQYSHGDIPRKETVDMEIIDYNLVQKREYPYSVIQRIQKKEKAFADIKATAMFDDLADESNIYEKYR